MTDDNTDDTRDPLRAAFQDYQRAPADSVPYPRWPADANGDLAALDGQTVDVVSYETTPDGVTKHVTRETITAPFHRKRDQA